MVKISNDSHILVIVLSYDFMGFLCFFCTFAHNVGQSWYVLPETWHTTLFDTYYCVEVVRMENHNHMLEITF